MIFYIVAKGLGNVLSYVLALKRLTGTCEPFPGLRFASSHTSIHIFSYLYPFLRDL